MSCLKSKHQLLPVPSEAYIILSNFFNSSKTEIGFGANLVFLEITKVCAHMTVTRYYLVQFWLGWTAMMPRWKRAWEVFMLHFGALINIFLKFRCIKTIDKWKRSIFVSINRMWNITRRIIKFDRTSWKTAAVAGFVHFLFSYLPLKCIHISLTFTPCVILCQLQMALQFLRFHQKNIVRV